MPVPVVREGGDLADQCAGCEEHPKREAGNGIRGRGDGSGVGCLGVPPRKSAPPVPVAASPRTYRATATHTAHKDRTPLGSASNCSVILRAASDLTRLFPASRYLASLNSLGSVLGSIISCSFQFFDRPPCRFQAYSTILRYKHVGDQLLHAMVQRDQQPGDGCHTQQHEQR